MAGLAVAIALTANLSERGGPQTSPASTGSPTTSASPAAGASPTTSASPTPASVQPGPLAAGVYANDRFEPPFSLEFGDGWYLHNSYVDHVGFIREDDENQALDIARIQVVFPAGCPWNADQTPAATALVGRTSDDVVRWVLSHPTLEAGSPQPAVVAGISGLTIDADVARGPGAVCASEDDPTGDYVYLFPVGGQGGGFGDVMGVIEGTKLRFIILEANERATTIIVRAPADDFDAFSGIADDVVATLILDPGS